MEGPVAATDLQYIKSMNSIENEIEDYKIHGALAIHGLVDEEAGTETKTEHETTAEMEVKLLAACTAPESTSYTSGDLLAEE